MNVYQSFLDDGYEHVICLTLSESLSGTFNSANLATGMVEDASKKITVFDTKAQLVGPNT